MIDLADKNLKYFQDNAQKLREFNLYLLDQTDSSFLNLYFNIYFGNSCKVLEA